LCFSGETVMGKIVNVSEGGLALSHFGLAAVEGVVTVQFELPSAEPQTFEAKASVIWNDASAIGLRFLRIEPGCRPYFEAWLDSLEAQLHFRESDNFLEWSEACLLVLLSDALKQRWQAGLQPLSDPLDIDQGHISHPRSIPL